MRSRMRIVIILIIFFSDIITVSASDCYSYYTKGSNVIKVEKGKAFLIKILKDPNDVSIVSYRKLLLENVKTKNIRIISENREGVFIANSEFYYWLKDTHELEQPVVKIIKSKDVTKTFGKSTFLINGRWTHIHHDRYFEKTEYTVIDDFPVNPVIIKQFNDNYLLKDESKVYTYNENEKKLKEIPSLEAKNICFFFTGLRNDEHFLYDDNTFYLIDSGLRSLDITKSFGTLGMNDKFTNQKIRNIGDDYFLDFSDGEIWAYTKHRILLKNKDYAYFYPIKNGSYNEKLNLIYLKNHFYSSERDVRDERNDIDFSFVLNKDDLKVIFEKIYSDGKSFYELNYDGELLPTDKYDEIEDFKSFKTRYNNAVHSFNNNMSEFGIDDKYIYSMNKDLKKFQKIISYKSKIKDLKLAYAFDNKLLIEDEVIHSDMDLKTVEFLGSNVVVINFCDGGRINPVEVKYNYYFKDKKGIYLFRTGDKEMQKLNIKKIQHYNEQNFAEKFEVN